MNYTVVLIKTEPLDQLLGWHVWNLWWEAKHIAGSYWLTTPDALKDLIAPFEIVSHAQGSLMIDWNYDDMLKRCREMFGIDFTKETPSRHLIDQFK